MQTEKPHFNVAAALIRKDGKILVSKRPEGSHLEGLWEFPGGKQEQDETLKDCLEREIEEELGLKVKADKTLFTVDHEYDSKSISLHIMSCTLLGGEPRPVQCQEIKWLDPIDLPKLEFPPPDLKVIEFLRQPLGG
ncbi:MAG: (deoxy)nucleoside triphosphate pyrophosphohydrolase [Desulfobacterales bacterium]|nr:(deoxy)nucleoside triphosphate pyrophosphohydrolase [Desulfobacterales bacterium]